MKRSEPQWKRKAAREHCKQQKLWKALQKEHQIKLNDDPRYVGEWFTNHYPNASGSFTIKNNPYEKK